MSTVNRSQSTGASFWLDALDGAIKGNSEPLCKLGDGVKALAGWIADGLEPPPPPSPVAPAPAPPPATTAPLSPEQLVDDLLEWEGEKSHMYLDTKGFVTTGIGNMIPNAEAAKRLPFIDVTTGKPATPEQIEAAFATVDGMKEGRPADRYASATTLRLPGPAIRELAADRLRNEFLPALRRLFPGFDSYPAAAQKALVDMVYNMGAGTLGKFKNLRAACEAGDWERAAIESNRKGVRDERNEWTRQLFLEATAG